MRSTVFLAALFLLGSSLEAQRRQMTPPPDYWMTLDSVVTAVGVTEAQRADVGKHYEAVNVFLKRAAEERRAIREQMGGGGGPLSEEQRLGVREKFEGLQKEIDTHYFALRALLTAEQQAKFDALPRPRVAMMGPRQPGRS